jgi:hypothetical protein
MMQALRALGIDIDAESGPLPLFGQTPELPEEPRADTSQHYEYADKVTHGQRKKANARALKYCARSTAANWTPPTSRPHSKRSWPPIPALAAT